MYQLISGKKKKKKTQLTLSQLDFTYLVPHADQVLAPSRWQGNFQAPCSFSPGPVTGVFLGNRNIFVINGHSLLTSGRRIKSCSLLLMIIYLLNMALTKMLKS